MVELPLFQRIKESPLPDQFIAENFLHEAIRQGKTFAIAEGKYTGGAIINKCTIPGSTKAFHIGTVVNNRKQKEILLTEIYKGEGEAAKIVDQIGKDSPEMAMKMAMSIRKLRSDDIGIATTVEKTDFGNLIHVGFSSEAGEIVRSHFLTNEELKNGSYLANRVLIDGYQYLNGRFEEQTSDNESIIKISKPFEVSDRNFPDTDFDNLVQDLSHILRGNRLMISSMESCTGGAIADFLTNNFSYYHDVFDSSWVVYDERAKEVLGVPSSVMNFGMVYSEKTAGEMAQALKEKTRSYIVISTTGVMEIPDNRDFHNDYSPGTIYFAIMIGENLKTYSLKIDLKRRDLMKKEIVKVVLTELYLRLKQNKKIEGLHKPKIETSGYTYW